MKLPLKTFDALLGLLGFMVIWEIISLMLSNPFFPSPIKVFFTLTHLLGGEIYVHIGASLKRTLIGFAFALLIASSLGYITGLSTRLRNFLSPVLELLRPIPPIAWIPLAIIWMGVGDTSASFIIFIAAFYPIFTNVHFGVSSLPKVYHRVSKNYNISGLKKFVHIVFPFSLPYLIAGCKTSIGFSWMAVIAAEMIASSHGLGYFIEINRVLLRTDYVIAAMGVIGVVGFLMHFLLAQIERRVTSWKN